MTFSPSDPGQGPPPPSPPAGQPQQQYSWQGQQQYRPPAQSRPPKSSPLAAFGIADWLLVGTAGAALLGWLLSLFADVPVDLTYSLGAGLLAVLALAPAKAAMPKVLPFVAVLATLAGLLAVHDAVYTGLVGAVGVIVFVLVLLEMLAAIGALLVDRGLLSMPAPQPKQPRAPGPPPYQPQQQSRGGQQAYPTPAQPAQQAPQQGPAQPGQGALPAWPSQPQEPHVTGNFDPNQFDMETQRGQSSQAGQPGQAQGEGTPMQNAPQQGTKQFAPPSDY